MSRGRKPVEYSKEEIVRTLDLIDRDRFEEVPHSLYTMWHFFHLAKGYADPSSKKNDGRGRPRRVYVLTSKGKSFLSRARREEERRQQDDDHESAPADLVAAHAAENRQSAEAQG